jgi:chromosome transmission fidelity protein 1
MERRDYFEIEACHQIMAPKDFNHPFEPYPIQLQFMTAVFDCIEQRKIGIFESPTGTGKSLSLICGSLTWLRNHKRNEIEVSIEQHDQDDGEPHWILEHERQERRRMALQHRQDLENRLACIREKEKMIKKRYDSGEPLSKRRRIGHTTDQEHNDQEQFVLDDYDSDGGAQRDSKQGVLADYGISTETQEILKRLGMFTGIQAEQEDMEMPDQLKVFYCSRTHSQLSQFANELRRVRMPPVIENEDKGLNPTEISEGLKCLTLGSRKNLCINPKVNRLTSPIAINERCLELQQAKTPEDHRCPYLPNKENEVLVNEFRDHVLAEIRDIEDLGQIGRKIGVCPYYASRAAIRPSEVSSEAPFPAMELIASRL